MDSNEINMADMEEKTLREKRAWDEMRKTYLNFISAGFTSKFVESDAENIAGAEIIEIEQVMARGKYPNVTRIMAKKGGVNYVLENGRVYKEVKE